MIHLGGRQQPESLPEVGIACTQSTADAMLQLQHLDSSNLAYVRVGPEISLVRLRSTHSEFSKIGHRSTVQAHIPSQILTSALVRMSLKCTVLALSISWCHNDSEECYFRILTYISKCHIRVSALPRNRDMTRTSRIRLIMSISSQVCTHCRKLQLSLVVGFQSMQSIKYPVSHANASPDPVVEA